MLDPEAHTAVWQVSDRHAQAHTNTGDTHVCTQHMQHMCAHNTHAYTYTHMCVHVHVHTHACTHKHMSTHTNAHLGGTERGRLALGGRWQPATPLGDRMLHPVP